MIKINKLTHGEYVLFLNKLKHIMKINVYKGNYWKYSSKVIKTNDFLLEDSLPSPDFGISKAYLSKDNKLNI